MSGALIKIYTASNIEIHHVWHHFILQFEEETVEVVGQSLPLKQDVSNLYWNPAPPKMDLPSSYIQNTLFPEFHGTGIGADNDRLTPAGEDVTDRESVDTAWDEGDLEDKLTRDRYLQKLRIKHWCQ